MELRCCVKNYDWGTQKLIRKLCESSGNLSQENNNLPFAELWIGSHKDGHSVEKESGQKIKDFPFLLKVLSIEKPLSIQIHPDKTTAAILHNKSPTIYRDPYDKPEMIIALTDFKCLSGFISNDCFKILTKSYPYLKKVFGETQTVEKGLANLFSCDKSIIVECINLLLNDIPSNHFLFDLHKNYPYDIGVLVGMLMNYYLLKKDDAMFIPPNIIHSYISGDGIEIMNCSDNVIRGGLTQKYIDVENLLKYVDFNGSPIFVKGNNNNNNSNIIEYCPPSKFKIMKIHGDAYINKCNGLGVVLENSLINNKDYKKGSCLHFNGDNFNFNNSYVFIACEN